MVAEWAVLFFCRLVSIAFEIYGFVQLQRLLVELLEWDMGSIVEYRRVDSHAVTLAAQYALQKV